MTKDWCLQPITLLYIHLHLRPQCFYWFQDRIQWEKTCIVAFCAPLKNFSHDFHDFYQGFYGFVTVTSCFWFNMLTSVSEMWTGAEVCACMNHAHSDSCSVIQQLKVTPVCICSAFTTDDCLYLLPLSEKALIKCDSS